MAAMTATQDELKFLNSFKLCKVYVWVMCVEGKDKMNNWVIKNEKQITCLTLIDLDEYEIWHLFTYKLIWNFNSENQINNGNNF